ncbi:MAG: DinB family protein [Tepidisphaeraceae bacterium]|jgi:hypothetical protein
MADESLVLLLTEVRGKTLRLLEGVDARQAHFAPLGLQNTILWHAGHALVVVEHLAVAPATGAAPSYPAGWFDMFSWASRPGTVKSWPPLAEVVAALIGQQERLLSALRGLGEDRLSVRIGDGPEGRTVRGSILHGLHDEANHQGEIWLLRKLYDRRSYRE